jgi:hypothetical protein
MNKSKEGLNMNTIYDDFEPAYRSVFPKYVEITMKDFGAPVDFEDFTHSIHRKYKEYWTKGEFVCLVLFDEDLRIYGNIYILSSFKTKSKLLLDCAHKIVYRSESLGKDIILKNRE